MAGLEIVLCDIRPETLDYDYSQLKKLVDDDTLCILSTHLFGIPSDVAKIRSLIGDKKIFIVEDAAQAMGGEFDDQKLGSPGRRGVFQPREREEYHLRVRGGYHHLRGRISRDPYEKNTRI